VRIGHVAVAVAVHLNVNVNDLDRLTLSDRHCA
jgi:hypothetical protein